jgi:hypothetical protein
MKEAIELGKSYLFHGRMIYLGKVVEITLMDIVIKESCWMAEMGRRMNELIAEGITDSTEIECMPPEMEITIPRGSFARIPWEHPLPDKSQ